jgi:hypothetical protein
MTQNQACFVLSFGYWHTVFVLIQRALAARSTAGVLDTPLIAAAAKLFSPFWSYFPVSQQPFCSVPNLGPPSRHFRRFSLRGLDKVRAEWKLVCAAANLLMLFRSGWTPDAA